jgi:DNA-binding transcriptional MerR regulator
MEYTSGDLIQRFNVTNETIRSWAAEFRDDLSPGANPPEEGKHRRFTFDDLEVLTLVYEMREKKSSWEAIHAALDAGQRGIPATDLASLIPMENVRETERLYKVIEKQRDEIAILKATLNSVNTRADRAEGAQDTLKQQLAEAQETIIRLHIKIEQLEAHAGDD